MLPVAPPARRSVLAPLLAVAVGGAGALTVAVTPADAAAAPVRGAVVRAVQDTFTHRVVVRGWAYDPAHPTRSIDVSLYVGSTYLGKARANQASPVTNKHHRISGRHAYTFVTSRTAVLKRVAVTRSGRTLDSVAVRHVAPPRADRIISVAKRYVGKARYVEGGASPRRGFDCSGYTKYVFAVAKAGTLPHNAAAQKSMRGMRAVSASAARPGDLVFYHGGGGIFHVAIYAGHHKQYAAATPRDGIVHQNIWSSAVSYGRLR